MVEITLIAYEVLVVAWVRARYNAGMQIYQILKFMIQYN